MITVFFVLLTIYLLVGAACWAIGLLFDNPQTGLVIGLGWPFLIAVMIGTFIRDKVRAKFNKWRGP